MAFAEQKEDTFQQVLCLPKTDPLFGLTVLEVNPTELCNRLCSFCPRVDPEVYPNRNLNMTEATMHNLVANLHKHNYQGRLVFSGLGEPTLNKNILKLIKIASAKIKDVQMYTNGDKILDDGWYTMQEIIDTGLTSLFIDVYDSKQQHDRWREKIEPFKSKLPIHLSAKYNFPIGIFTNRAGTVKTIGIPQKAQKTSCFLPHTKAFVDWDGAILLCCNDWSRAAGSFGNINITPFHELWMSEPLMKIRRRLLNDSRMKAGSPCNVCNATGNQRLKDWARSAWEDM
jgi:MoaA/NifB/PqqE/SkfB family radical SAM enzyme